MATENIDDLLAQIEDTEVSTAKKSKKKKKKGGNKNPDQENDKNTENTTQAAPEENNAQATEEATSENPAKLTKNQKKRLAAKKKKIAEKGVGEQTDPPSVCLRDLVQYKGKKWPKGPEHDHPDDKDGRTAKWRVEDEEKRRMDADMEEEMWDDFRQAAEVHRTTRKWAADYMKPGVKLFDLVEGIESLKKIE